MAFAWNTANKRIDVQMNSASGIGKVDVMFEGALPKSVQIRRAADGALLKEFLSCAIQAGDDGLGTFLSYSLPVADTRGFFVIPQYNPAQPCPNVVTNLFESYRKMTTHHNGSYTPGLLVFSATHHFQVALGDNVHITITIEDVIV